jgi:hypothetical protein
MKLLDTMRDSIQRGRAIGWLALTALQALATCGFLMLAWTQHGGPWQRQAWSLALAGIIATWCLALRAIRSKIMELLALWVKSANGLLFRASRSGAHQIKVTLNNAEVSVIQKFIWSLRWIAAGITLPFLVMPIFTGMVCMALCWRKPELLERLLEWVLLGPLLTMMAAAYFVWVIVPAPARARLKEDERYFPSRRRRGWMKE